jgi:hypothetical protein
MRIAPAVHPITAVQLEWSLWTRDVEEDVIPTLEGNCGLAKETVSCSIKKIGSSILF